MSSTKIIKSGELKGKEATEKLKQFLPTDYEVRPYMWERGICWDTLYIEKVFKIEPGIFFNRDGKTKRIIATIDFNNESSSISAVNYEKEMASKIAEFLKIKELFLDKD